MGNEFIWGDWDFSGVKIFTSPHLTERKHYFVKRTWKERLFSRPWKPFKKTNTLYYDAPRTDYLVYDDGRTIICHPVMKDALEQELKRLNL